MIARCVAAREVSRCELGGEAVTTTIEMPEYAWRAELIAKVMFTRRADLNVVHAEARGAHHGWDLVVELLDGDAHTSQVFVVEVKATLKPEGFGHVAENVEVALRNEWIQKIARDAAKAADAPLPRVPDRLRDDHRHGLLCMDPSPRARWIVRGARHRTPRAPRGVYGCNRRRDRRERARVVPPAT